MNAASAQQTARTVQPKSALLSAMGAPVEVVACRIHDPAASVEFFELAHLVAHRLAMVDCSVAVDQADDRVLDRVALQFVQSAAQAGLRLTRLA